MRKLEDDADYQRRRYQMTQTERSLDARDRVAKNIHEQNIRDGKNTTFEEAKRHADRIAEKSDKQNS